MRFQFKKWWVAVRIVALALRIRAERYFMSRMLAAGEAYTCPRLVKMDSGIQTRVWKVGCLFKEWKVITAPVPPPIGELAAFPGPRSEEELQKRSA